MEAENYRFFLKKYLLHISPVAETFVYCLLPNHFHFLIRIKNVDQIRHAFRKVKKKKRFTAGLASDFIMERFSNFLNSYAKSFNKKYDRYGGLFIDMMRRVEINDEGQFGAAIFYIHTNAIHHNICKTIEQWPWSSYHSILSSGDTNLLRNEILNWFGGCKPFIQFHKQPCSLKKAGNFETQEDDAHL